MKFLISFALFFITLSAIFAYIDFEGFKYFLHEIVSDPAACMGLGMILISIYYFFYKVVELIIKKFIKG